MISLEELKKFKDQHYARNLVLRTDNVEVIVVCWLPGQGTPVHGHGESEVVEVILEGELTYTNYYPDGKVVSGVCKGGDISHTPVGVKHEIHNRSDKELVTLHVYTPPLNTDLQGYDLGYENNIAVQELQVTDSDVIKYLRAMPKSCSEVPNYEI